MTISGSADRDLEQFLDPGFLDIDQVINAIEYEFVVKEGFFSSSGLELRKCAQENRKLAIAINGGGAAGAYSAGLLEVLLDRLAKRGVNVDLLVGCSSGALNCYGVFLQTLQKNNPQFDNEPTIQQPYNSYIASFWSYLDQDNRASRWVVGRRSWIINLISKGLPSYWHKLVIALLLLVLFVLLSPYLVVAILLATQPDNSLASQWRQADQLSQAAPILFGVSLFITLSLCILAWFIVRSFEFALFSDVPLLRLLGNTGPKGDFKNYSKLPRRSLVLDRARVVSRDLVASWYEKQDSRQELIVTATDITSGKECLFTLCRPETYKKLLLREWMAVQFNSDTDGSKQYRSIPGSLFTLPENLLRTIVASASVPGAFPTQKINLYGPSSRQAVHHHYVDGGVLNNSPIHIAIDAGATHVISLEIQPFEQPDPLQQDSEKDESYSLFQAALATFTTVLEMATEEDMRRITSWNRFLVRRPESLRKKEGAPQDDSSLKLNRRIIPIYRIAPRDELLGTVEFDGHYEKSKRVLSLRDLLRRGVIDMQGKNIWAATMRHQPGWVAPDK